jgi:hypothetical protein
MWRYVALVRTDVSKEHIASILTVERISESGIVAMMEDTWTALLWRLLILNSTLIILTERVDFVSVNHGSLLFAP